MKRDLQHLIREEERTHGVRLNSLRSYVKHALTAGGPPDTSAEAERRAQEIADIKVTILKQGELIKEFHQVEAKVSELEKKVNDHDKFIKLVQAQQLQAQQAQIQAQQQH